MYGLPPGASEAVKGMRLAAPGPLGRVLGTGRHRLSQGSQDKGSSNADTGKQTEAELWSQRVRGLSHSL